MVSVCSCFFFSWSIYPRLFFILITRWLYLRLMSNTKLWRIVAPRLNRSSINAQFNEVWRIGQQKLLRRRCPTLLKTIRQTLQTYWMYNTYGLFFIEWSLHLLLLHRIRNMGCSRRCSLLWFVRLGLAQTILHLLLFQLEIYMQY